MSTFKSIRIQGVTYDFNHLVPMTINVTVSQGKADERTFRVLVNFGLHCFTDHYDAAVHSPDYLYKYQNEERAFCHDRYARSQTLPGIVTGLSASRATFLTEQNNYMLIEMTTAEGVAVPYAIFFAVERGRRNVADVVMTVISAYDKPKLVDKASKVNFGTLIAKTFKGQKVTPTRPQQIW